MKSLFDKIFGKNGGLRKKEIYVDRNPFSVFLPYKAFSKEEKNTKDNDVNAGYVMQNNNFCWIWKCEPLIIASEKNFLSIASVLKEPFPEGTILQFSLYGSPYLEDYFDYFTHEREKSVSEFKNIFVQQAISISEFFRKASKQGLNNLSFNTIKNFILYVSLNVPITADFAKEPERYLKEVDFYSMRISNVYETLRNIGVRPSVLKPSELITDLYRILNPDLEHHKNIKWNQNIPINKQIIYADTPIEMQSDYLKFGSNYVKILSPKNLPPEIEIDTVNNMYGFSGVSGDSMGDDLKQIHCPFIFTTVYYYKNLRYLLEAKAQQVLIQQAAGTLAPSIMRRQQEMLWMLDSLEKGEKFIKTISYLTLLWHDKEQIEQKINTARTMWTELGIEGQVERDILLRPMFVGALPGGFYKETINKLDRDFILNTGTAPFFAPIQGGLKGFGKKPAWFMVDRRGQLALCDFSLGGPNKNFFVTGGSGNGKSFFGNTLVTSYLALGSKVRIIDVGQSYKKICDALDGQFICITDDIVINFFENAVEYKLTNGHEIQFYDTELNPVNVPMEDKKDVDVDFNSMQEKIINNEIHSFVKLITSNGYYYAKLDEILVEDKVDPATIMMLCNIIGSMATSRTGKELNEIEMVIIEQAVMSTLNEKKGDATIDDIYEFLLSIEKRHDITDAMISFKKEEVITKAYNLAQSIEKYTTRGVYGKYFNGKSTVSFKSPLVVVELDGVVEDLRKVIVLAFATVIEQEVYLGDRKTFTVILLDEAWQTLSDNPFAGKFVEGLYRKARKYNCGVGIITQSLIDLDPKLGKLKYLGTVIKTQSSFGFHLQDKEFQYAKDNNILDVDDYTYEILVKKMPTKSLPRYSEIFINTYEGKGVLRMVADPFSYFLNTSDPDDMLFLNYYTEHYIEKGFDKKDAFLHAIETAVKMVDELGGMPEFRNYLNNTFKSKILKTNANKGV